MFAREAKLIVLKNANNGLNWLLVAKKARPLVVFLLAAHSFSGNGDLRPNLRPRLRPYPPPPAMDVARLLVGAGGIYASFLYYGSLQEDVLLYVSPGGTDKGERP